VWCGVGRMEVCGKYIPSNDVDDGKEDLLLSRLFGVTKKTEEMVE